MFMGHSIFNVTRFIGNTLLHNQILMKKVNDAVDRYLNHTDVAVDPLHETSPREPSTAALCDNALQGRHDIDSGVHESEAVRPTKKRKAFQIFEESPQGGGAPILSGQTELRQEEREHHLTALYPLIVIESEFRRLCLFRTNAVYNERNPGRLCCVDSCNTALGAKVLRSTNVLKAQMRRLGESGAAKQDYDVPDVVMALQQLRAPFEFHRDKSVKNWQGIIALESGIRVCRMHFEDDNHQGNKHFIVVDSWRKVIIDNGTRLPIPFAGRSHSQLLRRIGCASLEMTWVCKVFLSRIRETSYV